MAFFEHVILLKQDLSSSEIDNVMKTHEDTLNELNGNVVDLSGTQDLAAIVKAFNDANIGDVRAEAVDDGTHYGPDHDSLRISCILTLAAGDKVHLQSVSTSAGVDWYWGSGLGHFGGYLIG